MKLAINTDAISADFETAVLLGLEWGIEYFELKRVHGRRIPDITKDEIAGIERTLKTHQVSLSSLAPGLFKVPLEDEAIAAEVGPKLDAVIALADRLETRSLVIFGFVRDRHHTEDAALARIIDVFGGVARRAEREGIALFLENDRGLWGESPAAIRRILSGVGSPALRLNWDPGNLIGAFPELPFPLGYGLVRQFVGHLHVKDAKVGGPSGFTHAMVGSGDVNWPAQLAALEADGFSGFAVIEPHYGSRVESSRQHVMETRHALRIARATKQAGERV